MKIQKLRNDLEQLKGKQKFIEEKLILLKKDLRFQERELSQYEEARDIIRAVARITQSQLEYKISEISTLALSTIFPNPYRFIVNFVLKRNKIETELLVEDSKRNKFEPLNSNGGGIIDVISFALRITLWALKQPRTNSIIILDEPFKFLSRDLQKKASELIKSLSKKFKIQFIIVSHDTALIESADKVFNIEKINNVSVVKEISI